MPGCHAGARRDVGTSWRSSAAHPRHEALASLRPEANEVVLDGRGSNEIADGARSHSARRGCTMHAPDAPWRGVKGGGGGLDGGAEGLR